MEFAGKLACHSVQWQNDAHQEKYGQRPSTCQECGILSPAKHLWADVICVNQSDSRELRQQLSVISDIYRQAGKVILHHEETGKDTCIVECPLSSAEVLRTKQDLAAMLSFDACMKTDAAMKWTPITTHTIAKRKNSRVRAAEVALRSGIMTVIGGYTSSDSDETKLELWQVGFVAGPTGGNGSLHHVWRLSEHRRPWNTSMGDVRESE